MKHYFCVTLFGNDEDGSLFFITGFASGDEQIITKADIQSILDSSKEHGDFKLQGISYMGYMTEEQFESRSAA
ncbi:hypothetical protein [Pseudomonas putida]|uniref:hypothetical protein n=1 Tax=Pseudomonas putida TaxID=303 RepID=UPI002365C703|nr:hypothetical protein [Pseudomonas putida]MDD2048828.1 hypothetical protein [Pseudomonas putida]